MVGRSNVCEFWRSVGLERQRDVGRRDSEIRAGTRFFARRESWPSGTGRATGGGIVGTTKRPRVAAPSRVVVA